MATSPIPRADLEVAGKDENLDRRRGDHVLAFELLNFRHALRISIIFGTTHFTVHYRLSLSTRDVPTGLADGRT